MTVGRCALRDQVRDKLVRAQAGHRLIGARRAAAPDQRLVKAVDGGRLLLAIQVGLPGEGGEPVLRCLACQLGVAPRTDPGPVPFGRPD